jgi:hypothetical protein
MVRTTSHQPSTVLHGELPAVYTSTEAAIRDLAHRFPRLGRFVAVLSISDDGPVRYEQSGESSAHYDLFGEPHAMLAAVRAVWPLEEGATDVRDLESGDGQP